MLSEVTKFVVICYSSNRKLIKRSQINYLSIYLKKLQKEAKGKNLRADFSEPEKQLRKSVKSEDSAMKFLVHVHAFLFDTLMIISGIAR